MINNGKAKIEKTFNELNIIIPSKKSWFVLLFLTFWIGGFFIGLVSFLAFSFFSETSSFGAEAFMIIGFIGCSVVVLVATSILLWGYFGQERFTTNRNEILFEKTVFGIGQKNRLDISEVENFRTELVNAYSLGRNNWAFWGLGPGKIKFDYGLKTYSFGLAVDDAEANYIVGLLKEQFKEQ